MLDATRYRLLNEWQRGFPLVPRPFAVIGAAVALAEDAVIAHYRTLQAQGLIDRIAPVFRPNTIGASTLAAIRVPPERLAEVAALVGRHPGVNHNYEREHRYNLWFVATGASMHDVERTLAAIERASGLAVLRLPLEEEFHIDLGFDLADGSAPRPEASPPARPAMSAAERSLAAVLAAGLRIAPRPYAGFGAPEAQVLELLARWLDAGIVRRIGAVVRHRRLGYAANAMAVWDVPDAQAASLGRRLAAERAVTLCYRRSRALPEWPYNLYCMLHGKQRSQVLRELEQLRAAHGLERYPHAVLFSRRCFGQRAARYG